jgi:hypothetical protein
MLILLALISIFSTFVAASTADLEAKHCSPRTCCGCPGSGKPQVKVLMDVFLDRLEEDRRLDAFQLISAENAEMIWFYLGVCSPNQLSIPTFYSFYFGQGNTFRNSDFEYVLNHDGSIDVKFLALVVTNGSGYTMGYDMVYRWTRDEQCNWHISAINGISLLCLLPPSGK